MPIDLSHITDTSKLISAIKNIKILTSLIG